MWPSRVLTVDCVGVDSRLDTDTKSEYERLDSWHAVALLKGEGGYGVCRTMCGTSADAFWSELYAQLSYPGTVWLYSNSCSRVWSLLGLWEELESGRLTITGERDGESEVADGVLPDMWSACVGKDDDRSAGSLSRMLDRRGGYLVIEDPPCIARLRSSAGRGYLCWADSANYGVCPPQSMVSGGLCAVWLAEWFRSYAEAMKTYRMGSLQATAGSQAMHGWRHGYYYGGVYAHCIDRALDLEGASYYGGRCEPLRIGEIANPAWHVDFRSLYPSVCRSTRLPVRLRACVDSPLESEAERATRNQEAIATVAIETDEPAYPYRRVMEGDASCSAAFATVSPHYGGGGTDTLFPVGRFVTTLAGPELLDALEHGRIKAWYKLATYQTHDCLRSYAEALYEFRCKAEESGNSGLEQVAKRLLVCLPGKFGQRDRRWNLCDVCGDCVMYGTWPGTDEEGMPCKYRAIAGIVQRDEELGWSADSVPSLAAWITSAGRVRLLRVIRVAGWQHVHYCDTDSLIVDGEGFYNLCRAGLVRNKELGHLYVKSSAATVHIHGVKYYTENGRVVCAGMPRGSMEDAGDGKHYWYQATPTEAVRNGMKPEAAKQLRPYDRLPGSHTGNTQADGAVTPLVLDEWFYGSFGVCLRTGCQQAGSD